MTADLPPGWAQAELGDAVTVLDRMRIPLNKAERDKRPGSVPYYGATGQVGWVDKPLFDEELLLLGEDGAPFNDPTKPKSYVVRGPSWVNNHAHVLRGLDGVATNLYLKHYLDFVDYRPYVTGTTRLKLTQRAMRSIPIRLPPVAEQERIVTAIEEHFSRLDAAETALCAARRRLDALLQSALRTLCDGSWTHLPLGHIIKSLKNGVFVSRPSATPPGYPIYRISAVRPLVLRIDDVRYANPVPNGASSYAVKAGDILFTRYSGNPDYVGAAAVVPHEGAGVLHPDKLIRVVADRDVALPEWIAAYVTAGTGRREVEKRLKTTAGQVGISGSQLGSVPIAVPPMRYQQQATDRIGHVLAEQTRIRQALSSTETTVGALRRSILSVAFSGRLVPQDPADEPAPVLLERITASRTAKPKRQKVKA